MKRDCIFFFDKYLFSAEAAAVPQGYYGTPLREIRSLHISALDPEVNLELSHVLLANIQADVDGDVVLAHN